MPGSGVAPTTLTRRERRRAVGLVGAAAGSGAKAAKSHARAPGRTAVHRAAAADRRQRIATPQGSLPTAMSAILTLRSVSITETLPERPQAT